MDTTHQIKLLIFSDYHEQIIDTYIIVDEELNSIEDIREMILQQAKIPKRYKTQTEIFIDCSDITGTPIYDEPEPLMKLFSIKDLLFQYLMATDFMSNLEASLAIKIKFRDGKIIKEPKRNKKQKFFEEEIDDAVMSMNQPKRDPIYLGTTRILCQLCGQYQNKEEQKILGRMYGPYKLHQRDIVQQFYVHHMCALWSGVVFINNEKFQNLQQAVLQSVNCKCGICDKMGASLGCKKSGCKFAFHPRCFLLDFRYYIERFAVLQSKFQFYCEEHYNFAEQDQDFIEQEMELANIAFDQSKCEICEILDTDIYCERCPKNRGFFHFKCLGILAEQIDEAKQWFCEKCALSMNINYKNQFLSPKKTPIKKFGQSIEDENQ